MSIIQEALRKAEGSSLPKKDNIQPAAPVKAAPPTAKTASPAYVPRTAKRPVRMVFILAPLAVILMIVAAFQAIHPKAPVKPALRPAPEASQKMPPTPVKAEASPVIEAPHFTLSGIMYIGSGSKAIVNGSVVSEGEMLSGASVKKIDKDSVTLSYEGKEILLGLD